MRSPATNSPMQTRAVSTALPRQGCGAGAVPHVTSGPAIQAHLGTAASRAEGSNGIRKHLRYGQHCRPSIRAPRGWFPRGHQGHHHSSACRARLPPASPVPARSHHEVMQGEPWRAADQGPLGVQRGCRAEPHPS